MRDIDLILSFQVSNSLTMQVIDQPDSFNLLNTLLFNIPNSPGQHPAYSSCAQYGPGMAGLVSGNSFLPGSGHMGFINAPVSPLITPHNIASSHQNSKMNAITDMRLQYSISDGIMSKAELRPGLPTTTSSLPLAGIGCSVSGPDGSNLFIYHLPQVLESSSKSILHLSLGRVAPS